MKFHSDSSDSRNRLVSPKGTHIDNIHKQIQKWMATILLIKMKVF